jgi:hypothetical protein
MTKKTSAMVAVMGFLTVFGAVGGMEDPDTSLIRLTLIACAGLALMWAGIQGIKDNH